MQVQAVGIPWYREEDFDRLRAMFSDGSKIGTTFGGWLHSAEAVYEKLTSEGHVVVKAYIDPETFPKWCAANGKELNAAGRNAYAGGCAAEKVRADMKNR
jgi:hypothetical protein